MRTSSAGMTTASQPYRVLWHPEAEIEYVAVDDVAERSAIQHAHEKLGALGPRLGMPHSSAIRVSAGSALRELRPRAGRSRWRPLYQRVRPDAFVILAVAPEAQIDRRGFDRAVAMAERRLGHIDL